MAEAAEHCQVVATVTVHGDLILLDAVVAAEPRHRLALIAVLVGNLKHHGIERGVDHRIRMVGEERLELAVELLGRHAAIDLADLVRED